MSHPEELLAAYVDGTVAGTERSRVEEHLAECGRCREEVTLATEARAAVGRLPEVTPPPGLSTAVRRELRRRQTDAGERRGPRAWRVVTATAVAAGLAAAGVLTFATLRGEEPLREEAGAPAPRPAEAQGEAAPAAGGVAGEAATDALRAQAVAPEVTTSSTDYEPGDLAPLARRLRDDARAALTSGFPPTASDYYRQFDASAFASQTRRAVRCALADIPPEQAVVPLVIEEASFQGSPAYVAAFLQGPAPEQPYDRILIWVADRDSCALRSLASQQL